MAKPETKITAIKLLKNVYSQFKKISFDSNLSFQKLVNRSMHKYVEDEDFRNEINNYDKLIESGSNF